MYLHIYVLYVHTCVCIKYLKKHFNNHLCKIEVCICISMYIYVYIYVPTNICICMYTHKYLKKHFNNHLCIVVAAGCALALISRNFLRLRCPRNTRCSKTDGRNIPYCLCALIV